MAKVAFIGLGVMGFPMAGHLTVRGGHDITVYNRTAAKASAWVDKFRGRSAPTPADAARGADFVFACVGNDDDLRAVTVGPQGAFLAMAPGAIFVDHTTASAVVARELDLAARERELQFIDAPVSGGQAGAESGQLAIMCGGDEQAFARARSLIETYAKLAKLIGPVGSGQLTKMVNQIAIAGLVQGLSEAISFAERAGLDVEAVIGVISKGAAQSWQMENRWKSMHARQFDFGFAVDWMRKDLAICLRESERCGATLPVTALVDSYYSDIQSEGGARYDTSSLILRLDDQKP
jgi:3-hydroxyisobutyrate dehydrogenase